LVRRAIRFPAAALIFPILAAGLMVSVGVAGGVDHTEDASTDQVAPAGCRLPANWVLQDKIGDLLKRPALIIAPTGAQRQALLTERLRFLSTRDQLIGYFPDSEFTHAPNPVDAHVEPKSQLERHLCD